MSLIINDNEVMSDFFVDSTNRKLGNNGYNFVVPSGPSFINFTRIKRIALSQITMSYLPYNIYDGNNRITFTDGTNTYTSVLPYGYYEFITTTSPQYFLTPFTNALNANPYGWVFTVSIDYTKAVLQWTCSVPVRILASTMKLNLGIFPTTTLSTSFSGAIISGIDSNTFYICSNTLTKNTVRDCHTNSIINNVLGTISIDDESRTSGYFRVRREIKQMKVFDWSPTEPLGGEIDIYMTDIFGQRIEGYDEYKSVIMNLEFKIVSTRNPTGETLLKQY